MKIGTINGGDLRIKLVNNPRPNKFTILLEYCKTIAGHNVYQILEITFRNMGQQTTQTAPAYATENVINKGLDKSYIWKAIANQKWK